MAFVRCMQSMPHLDAVDEMLRCVCLRRTRTKGSENESEMGRFVEQNGCTVAEEISEGFFF